MMVRRVVTGHDADGKSVVISDEGVDGVRIAMMPGSETHNLWGADETLHFPDDGAPPATDRYFPPVGGFRFGFISLPPAGSVDTSMPEDLPAAFAEFEAHFPGMGAYMEPGGGGFHTTDTVDCLVVLEGELWLELDDNESVHLKAGDTVIQNGTRHAWRNHGTTTARAVSFVIGAHHDNVARPTA